MGLVWEAQGCLAPGALQAAYGLGAQGPRDLLGRPWASGWLLVLCGGGGGGDLSPDCAPISPSEHQPSNGATVVLLSELLGA